MIWRVWTVLLVVIVGGAWLLAVPYSPAPVVRTASVIGAYRALGLVPEAGAMTMSSDVGHDVFALPAADAKYRRAAMAAGGMAPGGAKTPPADHGAMQMGAGDHAKEAMPGMAMPGDHAKQAMPGMAEEGEAHAVPGMAGAGKAQEAGHGAMEAGKAMETGKPDPHRDADEGHGRGGVEDGLTVLAVGREEIAKFYGRGGTAVKAAIDMREWGFERDMVMGRAGDVIHLVVKNTGQMPHEFMLMDQAGMAAVDYRRQRADWSLLEHEATYEVPVLMPGDGIEMIVKIHKSGMWMYMCMFPYHMQLGMMGMLMTPDMMGKGGMRM